MTTLGLVVQVLLIILWTVTVGTTGDDSPPVSTQSSVSLRPLRPSSAVRQKSVSTGL